MEEHGDELRARAWAAPGVQERPSLEHVDVTRARARHRGSARVLMALLLVFGAVQIAVAFGMSSELWTPEPTLDPQAYHRLSTMHAVGVFTVLLPTSMGVLSVVMTPAALRIPGSVASWLGYVAAAGWGLGGIALLTTPQVQLSVDQPSFWGIGIVVGAMALLAIETLLTLWFHRARWGSATVLAIGFITAATLQLLAFARSGVQFAGTQLGFSTLGSGLSTLEDLVVPVSMGIAAYLVDSNAQRTTVRIPAAVCIVIAAVAPWIGQVWPGPPATLADLVAIVAVGVFALLLAITWLLGRRRADPRAIASLVAMAGLFVAACVQLTLDRATLDVHLHDTYAVLVPHHLVALTAACVTIGVAVDQGPLLFGRRPSTPWTTSGVLALAVAAGTVCWAQIWLGFRGMPRRYSAYVPDFVPGFETMTIGLAIGTAALLLLALGLIRGRRSSPDER